MSASQPKSPYEDIPELGVAMIGYAFMGKAHSNAFRKIPYMMYPPPAVPRLVGISGRDEKAVAEAAGRYGYEKYYTDWREMLDDDAVDILSNGGPNDLHAEPSILAAERGVHVFCEKPLGRTAEEAKTMLDAVEKAGVKHMVAHNYRFVPAIRQAYDLLQTGALGRIYHFRARYLQEWLTPEYKTKRLWRMNKERAGSGAMGDLGSHIIDLAHFLIGDLQSVAAMETTFVDERPLPDGSGSGAVDVDDAFVTAVTFANGAIGTLEATRFATGRKNHMVLEINAENGSILFNMDRFNDLEVYWVGDEPRETRGFHRTSITEDYHPWGEYWWPHGHIVGWEHTFVHEFAHFLDCIVNDKSVAPLGASFEDGYKTTLVSDAILESARTGKRIDLN